MGFSLRCPVCRAKFPWNPTAGFPDQCPNEDCNSRIGIEDNTVICMPSIRSTARTRSVDKVYRDIEAASEQRAIAAAEMAGVPVSEMSGLKITDLNSTRHEGDVAATTNEERQAMANLGVQSRDQLFAGGNAAEYSPAVQAGPYPNMGAHMRTAVQGRHTDMVARHCVGKGETGCAVIPGGAVTSEQPANEVLQPGYRRRG